MAILMTLILSMPATARNLTVVNSCGFEIYILGIFNTNSDEYTVLLGDEVLLDGYKVTVNLQGVDSGWDLIAETEDGSSVFSEKLGFSGVSTVYFHGDCLITGE